jgi:hypothetical protein
MRDGDRASVLNRTPVLFGAGGHFPDVRDQSVRVAAERAVHFFDPIQIRELVPIDREVSPTRHRSNSVDGEANQLIERYPEIEHDQGQQQGIDDWSGQKTEDVAFEDIGGNALAKPPMCLAKLTIEPDPPAARSILQSAPSVLEFTFQLRLSVTNSIGCTYDPRFRRHHAATTPFDFRCGAR